MVKLTYTDFNLSLLPTNYSITKVIIHSRKKGFSYECWELIQKEIGWSQSNTYIGRNLHLLLFIAKNHLIYLKKVDLGVYNKTM